MVGVPSIPSYIWSSSRCKSLDVLRVALFLALCLSVSLSSEFRVCFIAGRRCSSFPSSLYCFLGFGLLFLLLASIAFHCFGRTSQFRSSRDLASRRVQNFPASDSSSELSSHQIPLGPPGGEEVQNFTASSSSSELSSHQISLGAPSDVCAKTRFQSRGSSTTTAEGLSYCVHHQVHSLRHHRRRDTIPAHAGSPPLQHVSAVWSCCYRLAPSGRPLRLRRAPHSSTWLRGRWYVSAAPASFQPWTLCPTFWTSGR